jgi:hypothetical protein
MRTTLPILALAGMASLLVVPTADAAARPSTQGSPDAAASTQRQACRWFPEGEQRPAGYVLTGNSRVVVDRVSTTEVSAWLVEGTEPAGEGWQVIGSRTVVDTEATTQLQRRWTRTVVDVPAVPGSPAQYETRTKRSMSSFITGWIRVGSEKVVTREAEAAVTHDESAYERTVIEQEHVAAVPAVDEVSHTEYEHARTVVTQERQEAVPEIPERSHVEHTGWLRSAPADGTTWAVVESTTVVDVPAQPAVTATWHEYRHKHGNVQMSDHDLGTAWERTGVSETRVLVAAVPEQSHTEHRYVATVIDQASVPGTPEVPEVSHVETSWSGSATVEGSTPTGAVRKVITREFVPGTDEVAEQSRTEASGWVREVPAGDGWAEVDQRVVIDEEAVAEQSHILYSHERQVTVVDEVAATPEVSHEEVAWSADGQAVPEGEGWEPSDETAVVVVESAVTHGEHRYERAVAPLAHVELEAVLVEPGVLDAGRPAVVVPATGSVVAPAVAATADATSPFDPADPDAALATTGTGVDAVWLAGSLVVVGAVAVGAAALVARRRADSEG